AHAEPTAVTGHVVDADGRPVANAEIGTFWSFEGGGQNVWNSFKTDATGAYAGEVDFRGRPVALLAYDAERTRSGLVVLNEDTIGDAALIRIEPSVRLHGTITSTALGAAPDWSNVYIMTVPDRVRIASSGGRNATFDLTLPPGAYTMWAYGTDLQDHTADVTLTRERPDHDLGALDLPITILAQHYGKEPPKWSVADARGVKPDVQLADYKGKWVLLEYWGFW
ncbi:MAG: hypothetical protein KDA28_10600, partial [Phycisphaerales bacterium]|nr:hypothetical protein [Phycisphaerales bacterium]